jgi:hypothetical protein
MYDGYDSGHGTAASAIMVHVQVRGPTAPIAGNMTRNSLVLSGLAVTSFTAS